jgi:hypothetical protein
MVISTSLVADTRALNLDPTSEELRITVGVDQLRIKSRKVQCSISR